MSLSKLFSSNHIRHSYYLQPTSDDIAPPSSFARSSGTAFKNSLRKIPSSLFSMGEGAGKEKDAAKDLDHNGGRKPKTRTRKVLGEILNWGNIPKTKAPPPKVSAPQTLKPSGVSYPTRPFVTSQISRPEPAPEPVRAVPLPVPFRESKTVLKKPSTKQIHSQPTRTALTTSLQPSSASTTETIRRPSMGADPFHRRREGAEVVEHVVRHGITRSSDGKRSVSSRATSARTSGSDRVESAPIEAK